MLRLWNKLRNMKNDRLPKMVFLWEYNLGLNNWCSEVEQILSDINCNEIFDDMKECDLTECKTRLVNEYILNWETSKLNKPKLRSYNLFKERFGTENYVKYGDKYIRSHTAQLRSGILPLNIELGRHRNIDLIDRKCTLCDLNEIEDEYHFICKCPVYKEFRDDMYSKCRDYNEHFDTLPDREKFVNIMKKSSKSTGRFIVNSFEKRRKILYK